MVGKLCGRRPGRCRGIVAWGVLLLASVSFVVPAFADEDDSMYDPQLAGHPLKIVAYAAFPVGVLLDYGLLRPARWVGRHEPFATIFGYKTINKHEFKEDAGD